MFNKAIRTKEYLVRMLGVIIHSRAAMLLFSAWLFLTQLLTASTDPLNEPWLSKASVDDPRDLTHYVNPFIGTGAHGHTFPGATVPFGMVQLSPDTRLTGWDGCSGYHYSDNQIYGFSHTHLSGTGISDYGDILFMPTLTDPSLTDVSAKQWARTPALTRKFATRFNHANESASPGYYRVKLDDGILVELTATARVGIHRYTFPAQSALGNVILDLTHRDKVLDSYLHIVDQTHIEGFRRSEAWARNQIVYFFAEFSEPFQSWDTTNHQSEIHGDNVKAIFRFNAKSIILKVGISAVSIDGARKNLDAEASGANFDDLHSKAVKAWNSELQKVQVSGGNGSQLTAFYTALYHADLAPNLFVDVDGQYLGRDFKIHKAKGFDNYTVFSLWDTFRAAHPLYTILNQKRSADFINTFLAQYQQGGRLPVWELAANETDTMIGYHAVSVIADAAAKDITGFDRQLAFEAMKHSAELRHFGLGSYLDHGYIEMEDERESVSKTLEYAYDDWCIAMMAGMLNHGSDYERYLRRAQSYKNIFDRESSFMRPRTNAGWLASFDPREVNFNFTEANSWQYSFFVPQDVTGLMRLLGGKRKLVEKLDALFAADTRTTGREQADITGLIGQYAHGNEPSHHIAYLYDYAQEPWKTQYRVRQILDRFYTAMPDGLIGNEDCGQMSAWYVLSALGFYSVTPGSPIYALGTPLFPEVRLNLENGKSFVIKAHNVSTKNFYIQSAMLNGVEYRKSFLTHADLMAGGEVVFEMGNQPNTEWFLEPPVSAITIDSIVPVPVIGASSKTFKDRERIDIKATDPVRYTIDGTEPTATSPLFRQPFYIDQTTVIKTRAIAKDGHMSQVATASFKKLPHNWSITLKSEYSSQYGGGGDQALIDGVRGTTNFSGGGWQGFQGQDLVATVDLGKPQSISKLGVGFLQDVRSWILMPPKVDFEVSTDGQKFVPVLSIKNDVSDRNSETVLKDFSGKIEPRVVRYVRVTAKSYGKLPEWHAGASGDSWIFADEIVIE
ncbi:MAG: GH92 family glycosyl hydrolase [Pyrinomonadaceae bacterium]